MQKLYVPGNVFQRALSIETGVVCCSSKRYLAITHSMLSNVRLTCQNHYTRAADEHQCERNSVIICDDRRHVPVIAVMIIDSRGDLQLNRSEIVQCVNTAPAVVGNVHAHTPTAQHRVSVISSFRLKITDGGR